MSDARPLAGIALLLGALFFFAALDAIAKYVSQSVAIPLMVWGRYLVHFVLMAVLLGPRLGRRLIVTGRPVRQVVRALLLVGCTGFGFAALSRMPLAETTATAFTAPLIVALLAGPWLGERLGPGRWLAVATGFAGVLLIARPGGTVTPDGLAFALAAATCYAAYQILTRQLAATENTLTMLFYTALVGTTAMSLALPWTWDGMLPSPASCGLIAVLGVLGACGHFLLTRAFRHAPASTLSPFLYLQMVWALLLGWLVFDHWPDALALAGTGVIVGSGVYLGWSARHG